MQRLSIIGLTLPAIVLLTHILFDLTAFMPGLLARILIAVCTLSLLSAGLRLYSLKNRQIAKESYLALHLKNESKHKNPPST